MASFRFGFDLPTLPNPSSQPQSDNNSVKVDDQPKTPLVLPKSTHKITELTVATEDLSK